MSFSKTKRHENRRMGVFLAVLSGLNILLQVLLKVENLVKLLRQ